MCLMCALNSWFFCLYFSSVPPHLTFLNSCFSSTRDWTQGFTVARQVQGTTFLQLVLLLFSFEIGSMQLLHLPASASELELQVCATTPICSDYRCMLQHTWLLGLQVHATTHLAAKITGAHYHTPGCQDCRCTLPYTWLLGLQVHAATPGLPQIFALVFCQDPLKMLIFTFSFVTFSLSFILCVCMYMCFLQVRLL